MKPTYKLNGVEVEGKESPFPWQERGLSYTRSGYGRRIPTSHMIRLNRRWRRVYCCQYSNAGACYIGKIEQKLFVDKH
jgi:hypothetical protein